MIITDEKNTAYANVSLDAPFSVKAEARKDIDGGYCALFYVDGRSVALGRKETLDEAKGMVTDFVTSLRKITEECERAKRGLVIHTFDYDEPVEIEDEPVEADDDEHFE